MMNYFTGMESSRFEDSSGHTNNPTYSDEKG
jgi:hypothetical protein